MKRKILSLTGSRSDYGIMTPVFSKIKQSPNLSFDLVVTGMHHQANHSIDIKEIVAQRFGRLYYLNPHTLLSMSSMSGYLLKKLDFLINKIQPDIILIQGDRFEMLALAIAASYHNIAIVHMSGGDFSGSIDDSIRNAISCFAHIHLTTCSLSSQRLLNRSEQKNRIIQVGEPGLDVIANMTRIPKRELFLKYQLNHQEPLILLTFHPVTTESNNSKQYMLNILSGIDELKIPTLITYPNSDLGYKGIIEAIDSFKKYSYIKIVPTLGSTDYLNFLSYSSVLVGNTSSGIIEAPSFKTPFVNIGTRQINRLRANNVIDVGYSSSEIVAAVKKALYDQDFRLEVSKCVNPYGDGTTSTKVVNILEKLQITPNLFSKWIYNNDSFI